MNGSTPRLSNQMALVGGSVHWGHCLTSSGLNLHNLVKMDSSHKDPFSPSED